jgi:NAD(P) transhydrogenase
VSAARAEQVDLLVIGAGPAGQKAAVQAAKAGARVLLVDEEAAAGGACVRRGTIPSKTLRETAVAFESFSRRTSGALAASPSTGARLDSLMARLDHVVRGHEQFIGEQLARNHVELWRGRARFVSPRVVEVRGVDGRARQVVGAAIVIATGSRPRNPPDIPIDHEHILDSDSILSLGWLPASLVVLGAGVIACEYASIFAALGVQVTLVDAASRPLAFLDAELGARFVTSFERMGGRFLGGRRATRVGWNGIDTVVSVLDDGGELRSEKLLFALGREANLAGLDLAAAGLAANARGHLTVDEHGRTAVPHIYAVGDVVGPPALATTAMEQGRRAACHALGQSPGRGGELVPVGVYTIPELASVGLDERAAVAQHGAATIGRARFDELARGRIAAAEDGLLKLVADAHGRRLLGVQIVGEGAAELIHVGQMALIAGFDVDVFVDHAMNFPTLAEAYRVAALDVMNRRCQVVRRGDGADAGAERSQDVLASR